VRVIITNDTNYSYNNFDSYGSTSNMFMAKPGIKDNVNKCSLTMEDPYRRFWGATLSIKDKPDTAIPLFSDSDHDYFAMFYHLQCNKVAPHSYVELLLPVVGLEVPKWTAFGAKFDALGRDFQPSLFTKCFVDSCPNLPATFRPEKREN